MKVYGCGYWHLSLLIPFALLLGAVMHARLVHLDVVCTAMLAASRSKGNIKLVGNSPVCPVCMLRPYVQSSPSVKG